VVVKKRIHRQAALPLAVAASLLAATSLAAPAGPRPATRTAPRCQGKDEPIRGYPIPGLAPTPAEKEDPAWDVPVVPVLPEKPGAVPADAAKIWGFELNKGIQGELRVHPHFRLKYCFSRPLGRPDVNGHEYVYLIDPSDYRTLFAVRPGKPVRPGPD